MQKHLSSTKVIIVNCQRYAKARENRCLEGCQEKEWKWKEQDSTLFMKTAHGNTSSNTLQVEVGMLSTTYA